MTYRRPVAILAVLGGIVIFLVIIGSGNSFGVLGGLVRKLFNPFSVVAYRLGEIVRPDTSNGVSADDLRTQLEKTQEESRRLAVENVRLLTLENENQQLRDYLDFTKTRSLDMQMAEVIARGVSEDSWRNRELIILNQGTDQGLTVGLPVVSSEGVLIGKITAVKNNSAEACLLYSPDCRLAVGLAGIDTTIGIAHGDLGLTILIEFIPQNQTIEVGQAVVTSGLENNMPPGLLLGRVNRVIKQGNELWQSAVVEPAADSENLRFVAVLK